MDDLYPPAQGPAHIAEKRAPRWACDSCHDTGIVYVCWGASDWEPQECTDCPPPDYEGSGGQTETPGNSHDWERGWGPAKVKQPISHGEQADA